MSSPKKNATPAEMARLAKLNQKLYGANSRANKDQEAKQVAAEMGKATPAKRSVSNGEITAFLSKNKGMSDRDIRKAMDSYGVNTKQMSEATGTNFKEVQDRYDKAGSRPPRPTPSTPPRTTTVTPPRPRPNPSPTQPATPTMKKGGSVAKTSRRADGTAQRGKTKGRYI